MRLVMNQGHEYVVYGKKVHAGEEFEVPDKEAGIWIRLGRARTRTMAAEEDPAPRRSRSGRYQRSDMRAEDE